MTPLRPSCAVCGHPEAMFTIAIPTGRSQRVVENGFGGMVPIVEHDAICGICIDWVRREMRG